MHPAGSADTVGRLTRDAAAAPAAESADSALAAQAAETAAVEMEEGESAYRQNMTDVPPCVYVVNNRQDAARVCNLLMTHYRDRVFGADTEVGVCWLKQT